MFTRSTNRFLSTACAGCALATLLAGPSHAEAPETKSIEDRLQQYETRFNTGDAEALARLYSEDVVYYDPLGKVHSGRGSVHRYYQRSLAAGFRDMVVDPLEIEVFGETAYDIARYTITSPDGVPLTGFHLAILAKEDGEWLVQRTLVNVGARQPPADQGR